MQNNAMSSLWSPGISDLKPYTPGEQPQVKGLLKLNTNEHPLAPSPKVLEAMRQAIGENLRLYPDPTAMRLRQAIAHKFKCQAQQVFVGNGSDEVLAHAFYAFFRRGGPLLYPEISYGFYPVYCGLYGIQAKPVALDEHFGIDPQSFSGSASADASGIIFPNPNAPTGIDLPIEQVKLIVESNPHCVVLVDEAYVDFGATSAASLIDQYPNLLVVQTLSKSMSLAGLRVGFALGQASLIDALNRVKDSFNSYPLDQIAQVGATAAIEDQTYSKWASNQVIQAREQLMADLKTLGFEVLPSKANFVFARHPNVTGAELTARLREQAILVRHFDLPRIRDFVRITVGTFEQGKRLTTCIKAMLTDETLKT